MDGFGKSLGDNLVVERRGSLRMPCCHHYIFHIPLIMFKNRTPVNTFSVHEYGEKDILNI